LKQVKQGFIPQDVETINILFNKYNVALHPADEWDEITLDLHARDDSEV
jgi:hypothetical protein